LISEQKIIEGCKKQDKGAQKALFEYCYPKLRNVCSRYSNNAEDAEDLIHDTYIKVFDKISTFKGNSSLTSWVCSIAVNAALSNFRKNKKFRLVDLDSADVVALAENRDDTFAEKPNLNKAIDAIRQLPEGYQMVLNLYAVENYSHKQIAQALDISVGTSKSQLARARKKLTELIKGKK
jgi:RNA polymerase sigma factor (sigma-70 family)